MYGDYRTGGGKYFDEFKGSFRSSSGECGYDYLTALNLTLNNELLYNFLILFICFIIPYFSFNLL